MQAIGAQEEVVAWYRGCGKEWGAAHIEISKFKLVLRMQPHESIFTVEPVAGLLSAATGDSWWPQTVARTTPA